MGIANESIQVCSYAGEWPNHEEIDCENVRNKQEAIGWIINHRKRDQALGGKPLNYRIVDWMNRFPCMFFESNDMSYTHKERK